MLLVRLYRRSPEALEVYRTRVDPLAGRWYQEGVRNRDARLLRRVVDQMFASRYGDDALLRLGEMALAEGRWERAREYWEQIAPTLRVPINQPEIFSVSAGGPLWLGLGSWRFGERDEQLRSAMREESAVLDRLVYPDTDLDVATVRARLTLVSILQGDQARAELELNLMRLLHPDASGRLAGKSGNYVETLASVQKESADWPALRQTRDWPLFAGSPTRNRNVDATPDPAGQPLWTAPLVKITARGEEVGFGRQRIGESVDALLSVHPVVVGERIFIPQPNSVSAYRVADGAPRL